MAYVSSVDDAQRSIAVILKDYPGRPSRRPERLSEEQINRISELLAGANETRWSKIPRIYAVLHIINRVHIIESFVAEDISDLWFPFAQRTLPEGAWTASDRYDFIQHQDFVLTKAVDLEREDGRHRHFASSDEVPLKKLAELGKGGFGKVDRVLSTITHREYARKRIPRGKTFGKNVEKLREFEREISHLKKLRHEHIVRFIGSYTDPRLVCILISPVADANLRQYLASGTLTDGQKSLLRTFYGCLATAVQYLHENRVRHKDIKPQNILIKDHQVFLTDFGISLDWSITGQSTTTGDSTKTERYCAPEVAQNLQRNASSDLWSLGCVFLEIWTVFKGQTLDDLDQHLTESDSETTCYHRNSNTILSWCNKLEAMTETADEDPPLAWIEGTMQVNPAFRWSAQKLVACVTDVNDRPGNHLLFLGDCCSFDNDTTTSDASSTRMPGVLEETGASSISVYEPARQPFQPSQYLGKLVEDQSGSERAGAIDAPENKFVKNTEASSRQGQSSDTVTQVMRGRSDENESIIMPHRVANAEALPTQVAPLTTNRKQVPSRMAPLGYIGSTSLPSKNTVHQERFTLESWEKSFADADHNPTEPEHSSQYDISSPISQTGTISKPMKRTTNDILSLEKDYESPGSLEVSAIPNAEGLIATSPPSWQNSYLPYQQVDDSSELNPSSNTVAMSRTMLSPTTEHDKAGKPDDDTHHTLAQTTRKIVPVDMGKPMAHRPIDSMVAGSRAASRIARAAPFATKENPPINWRMCLALRGHDSSVYSVAFSPNGKLVASGSEDHTIRLWDTATGQVLRTLSGHQGVVTSVAFSPDGKLVASGSCDYTIQLWDTATGQVLHTLFDHNGEVTSVAFSPDGKLVASGSCDYTIQLWNTVTGRVLRTLSGHKDKVISVAFSSDGKLVASGSYDYTIQLWDTAIGCVLHTLSGHKDKVTSVAFSPDGKLVASGSYDYTIRLWDTVTGRVLRTFSGHKGAVVSVAFSPDWKLVASGSYDHTIRLWNTAAGRILHTLSGHKDSVVSVAFSPDGKLVASGSYDNTIRLWGSPKGVVTKRNILSEAFRQLFL